MTLIDISNIADLQFENETKISSKILSQAYLRAFYIHNFERKNEFLAIKFQVANHLWHAMSLSANFVWRVIHENLSIWANNCENIMFKQIFTVFISLEKGINIFTHSVDERKRAIFSAIWKTGETSTNDKLTALDSLMADELIDLRRKYRRWRFMHDKSSVSLLELYFYPSFYLKTLKMFAAQDADTCREMNCVLSKNPTLGGIVFS